LKQRIKEIPSVNHHIPERRFKCDEDGDVRLIGTVVVTGVIGCSRFLCAGAHPGRCLFGRPRVGERNNRALQKGRTVGLKILKVELPTSLARLQPIGYDGMYAVGRDFRRKSNPSI
jgi:hypothetical protein